MSSQTVLKATERDNTLNPRQLRAAGFLPATLYGNGQPSQSLQVREYDFVRLYAKKNANFFLEGPNVEVKVQQVQIDAVSQKVLCIEFMYLHPVAKASQGKQSEAAKAEPALSNA